MVPQPGGDAPPRVRSRRRILSAVAICWCVAGLAVAFTSPPSDGFVAPDLLLGPVDRQGLRALALLTSVVSCATAVLVTASAVTRPPARRRLRVLASAMDLATGAALLLAYPLLLIGALSFSGEYRTIGSVDGHELIERVDIGLGQFPISVGLRHGWSVDSSRSSGDTDTTRGPTLEGLRFEVEEGPEVITVIHRPGPRPGRAEGVLRLPR